MRLSVAIVLTVAVFAALGAAQVLSSRNVWLHYGADDYVNELPFYNGLAQMLSRTNMSLTKATSLRTAAKAFFTWKLGVNITTDTADGGGVSAGGVFTLKAVTTTKPYRVFAVEDGFGYLRSLFEPSKAPTVMLPEFTLSVDGTLLQPGRNYTGNYKGPVTAGDILAYGEYSITQQPLFCIGRPEVIKIKMGSMVPGLTIHENSQTHQTLIEQFHLWSPQYGYGYGFLQIQLGFVPSPQGAFKVWLNNNAHFPAPAGIVGLDFWPGFPTA